MGQQAVIVFDNSNTHWSSKFLSKEINHCYMCVIDRGRWIVMNRSYTGVEMYYLDELPKGVYYRKVTIDRVSLLPCMPTCVGLIKHMLGIYSPIVQTPHQLYMRLRHGR